jgi:hypothetical protein
MDATYTGASQRSSHLEMGLPPAAVGGTPECFDLLPGAPPPGLDLVFGGHVLLLMGSVDG